MKLVVVEWYDTVVTNGWTDHKDAKEHEPDTVQSVGWVLAKDRGKIVIVHGTSDTVCNPYTVIPMGMVKNIREIEIE